jgi:class 3 adenylate cyclase
MWPGEEGTLERLKALRRELLDVQIAEHKGRIVKTTGDGSIGTRAAGRHGLRSISWPSV